MIKLLSRLGALALLAAGIAHADNYSVSPMQLFPGADNVPAAGDRSALRRLHDSVRFHIETSGLDPLSPYTVWAVIFNKPRYCASAPCSLVDLPFLPGHDQRVRGALVYAGGGVADADGRGKFIGEVFEARNGVVGPERQFGPGLLDARRAEIHFVVRGHGQPAAEDLFTAINTFAGGCNANNQVQPPCEDQQFAAHLAH